MNSWLGWMVSLWLVMAAKASEPPTRAPMPVSPERLRQLVAQLGADRFKERAQATEELSRLGRAALPALEEATSTSKDAEVRRRGRALIEEIRGRDRARDGLLTIVIRLQQTKPPPTDRQLAVAMHLLSLSRPATGAEIDTVEKALLEAKNKTARIEELMWPLLTCREFNDRVAEINLRVLEIKQGISGMSLAELLAKVNTPEYQKRLTELSRQLIGAGTKHSDEQLIDTLFLVFLMRFPDVATSGRALAHLKTIGKRDKGVEDLVWAMLNTREFLLGPKKE